MITNPAPEYRLRMLDVAGTNNITGKKAK
jgi:hypothetical protein